MIKKYLSNKNILAIILASFFLVACGKDVKITDKNGSLHKDDFVCEFSCNRPIIDPPLAHKLSADQFLHIQDELDAYLTRLVKKGKTNFGGMQVYFVPMHQSAARVIVISNSPIEDGDRMYLKEMDNLAQKIYEKEFGIVH